MKPGEIRYSVTLSATVTCVKPDGTCDECKKRPVTRIVEGGSRGDGSDWWEAYLCGNCLLAAEREQERVDEAIAKTLQEIEDAYWPR